MLTQNSRMVPRKKLLGALDALPDERILYVCAPAGYGKTVLARQWLTRGGYKSAIIALDEFDDAPAHFCRRFCHALCECQPHNSALQRAALHPAFDSAPGEFAIRAIAMLSKGAPARLVVDDLHMMENEQTLRLLSSLLRRLPGNFRVMLSSRNALPRSLSDLLLKGEMASVTADQLRFDADEIVSLYEKRGRKLSPQKIDEVRQFTDGWAIGLNALLLSGEEAAGRSLEYLEGFIRENIWRSLDERMCEFMLQTAVVRELTPGLCTAITGEQESGVLLEELSRRSIFISQTEPGVYRFHQLFRDFLRGMMAQRGREYQNNLLNRAGHWYHAHNDFYSAGACFMESENYDGIALCFGNLVVKGREYVPTQTIFPLAREAVVQRTAVKYPSLYAMLAWAAYSDGRPADMADYADRYYAHQDEFVQESFSLAQTIIFLRLVDFRSTISELLETAAEISQLLPGGELEDMRLALGTVNQNMPLLHRGTRDFSQLALGDIFANTAQIMAAFHGLFGDEAPLMEKCILAGLLYERGLLEQAHTYALGACGELKGYFLPESKFYTTLMLVRILDALEQGKQAEQAVEQIGDMIDKEKAYYLSYNWKALKTRRLLRQGDIQAAHGWLAEHRPDLYASLDFYHLYGHFVSGRAFITMGDYDSAIILLKKVLELARAYNRPLDIIEAQVLLSICFWKKKRGFQTQALEYLEQAAMGAHPYGYCQIFANEGAELSGMLHRLHNRVKHQKEADSVPASFVKMLYLKTLEQKCGGLTSGQPPAPVKYTEKQKAVMRLLCEGKSYREISEALGIKIPTLRSHISLIYKKLDVTQATDAVVKIKALGILGDN